ncbi:hypothetical protein NC651_001330 [Populus alba x Populus x berolinensis]|nr:hypothetical protein NC651_001330 [Populus alba x Populus x berolinensis]
MDGVCGLASGDGQRDWAFCKLWSLGFRVLSRDRRVTLLHKKTSFDDGDGVDRGEGSASKQRMCLMIIVFLSEVKGKIWYNQPDTHAMRNLGDKTSQFIKQDKLQGPNCKARTQSSSLLLLLNTKGHMFTIKLTPTSLFGSVIAVIFK